MAALKIKDNEARYLTKEIEIQVATHQDILKVGTRIAESTTTKQVQNFQVDLKEHDDNLCETFKKQQNEMIKKMNKKHAEDIRLVKEQYVEMQNNALKEEAARVEAVMKNRASELATNEILEGRRKLKEALEFAGEKFLAEKLKEISEAVKNQEGITQKLLTKLERKNAKELDKLNKEHKEKIEEQKNESDKKLIDSLAKQKKIIEEKFNESHRQETDALKQKYISEISEIKIIVAKKENMNLDAGKEIINLRNKLKGANEYIAKILTSFQLFVDSMPGFYKGQADYLLEELIPQRKQ